MLSEFSQKEIDHVLFEVPTGTSAGRSGTPGRRSNAARHVGIAKQRSLVNLRPIRTWDSGYCESFNGRLMGRMTQRLALLVAQGSADREAWDFSAPAMRSLIDTLMPSDLTSTRSSSAPIAAVCSASDRTR
jgi:hypothetical protein